jgi:hypothetical protein
VNGLYSLRVLLAICVLTSLGAGTARGGDDPLADWGAVTSLEQGRTVIVKRLRNGGKRLKGTLTRANERSIVVQTANGEEEVPREAVRRLLLRRRGWGKAPWIGAAIGFGAFAAWIAGVDDFNQPSASLTFGAAGAGLGALGGLGVRALARNKLIYRAAAPN